MKISKLIIAGLILTLVTGLMPVSLSSVKAVEQKVENINVVEYPTSARISWSTGQKSDTQIYYGSGNDYSTLIASDNQRHNHVVTLRALDPQSRYSYRIVATAKDGSQVERTGTFETIGNKKNLIVYQQYFTLLFDDYWRNINGVNPTKINEPDGLDFNQIGFTDKALEVNRPESYLQYSCDNVFHPGYGAVTAWVKFDRFDKSAVIWQTNDSRYALYYEVGNTSSDFDKRIVARAGGNVEGEYPEAEYIIDPQGGRSNIWSANEWHFVTMTWDGKFRGQVTLFIDGRKVDQAEYEDGNGCSTFRVGNNYRDNDEMFFSIGKIDELKVHQWAMHPYYVNQNYLAYSYSPNFENKGRVAGISVRNFSNGKLLKAPDNKVYIISRDKKIHISDMSALKRYKSHPIVTNATWDEVGQYSDGGKFHSWSRYPDGTLLKAQGQPGIYWVWNGKAGLISSPSVFHRYGNLWEDVITISQAELNSYPQGVIYY